MPQFAYDRLQSLCETYGDAHGVTPPKPLAIAALVHVADIPSLEDALKAYRKECKRRGVKHG